MFALKLKPRLLRPLRIRLCDCSVLTLQPTSWPVASRQLFSLLPGCGDHIYNYSCNCPLTGGIRNIRWRHSLLSPHSHPSYFKTNIHTRPIRTDSSNSGQWGRSGTMSVTKTSSKILPAASYILGWSSLLSYIHIGNAGHLLVLTKFWIPNSDCTVESFQHWGGQNQVLIS